MDSDLSLLEISEEDDSLLQPIPSEEMSSVNKYLSCSPLLRSAAPSGSSSLGFMKVDEHATKASHPSPSYKFNKENINANKPEVPNLSNEPQQMKRRKRGGGYNLRKSLAWNRAFFTEEGVLDPSELSMISGAFNKSNGGALSAIEEEGRNSIGGDSDSICHSAHKQSLEEHLFKESPGSKVNQGKMIASCFSPKCDSSARNKIPPASAASRKVLSAHDVNRSGSKRGGYSRPLASSSQKRPANASTTKAVIKESKIPKIPILKSDSGSLPVTTRTRSATLSSNQIARRALNIQKNVGFKGSSNSRRTVESDIKSGPGSKSLSSKPSIQPFRKDMGNLPRKMPLSSKLQSPQVANLRSGLRLIADPELPSTAAQASNAHDISTNYAVPLSQNPELISGNIQSAQLQARKPSSLRMPSPSIGFFGQSKASGSQIPLERGALQCKIPELSIPKLQKLGSTIPDSKLRPPRAPGKKLGVVNDVTSVRSLGTASSVPSVMGSVSQDNMRLNFQKVDEKIPQNQLHATLDDAVEQFQEHADPSKIEKLSCKGDKEMQVSDIKFIRSKSYELLDKNNERIAVTDAYMGSRDSGGNEMENSRFELQLGPAVQVLGESQINFMTEGLQAEDKECNSFAEDHDVIAEAESQATDDTSHSNQGVHRFSLISTNDVEDHSEQDELTKSCFGEDNHTSYEENQGPQTSDSILFQESRSSEASEKIDIENVSLNVLDLGGSELESVNDLPKYREQTEEATGNDILAIKSHVVNAQLQFLDCNLLVESCGRKLSTFAEDNQSLMVDGVNENSGEPSELQNPCLLELDCNELHSSDFQCNKLKNILLKVDGESEINCPIEQLHREDHKYNISANNDGVFSESQSGDVISCSGQDALRRSNSCISGMYAVDEPCVDHSELKKAPTCDTDQIFQEENRKMHASKGNQIVDNRSFEEFRKLSTENVADANPQIRGSSGSEFACSQPSFQLKCIDQANEEAARMYNMNEKSQLVDAKLQWAGNQFVENCKNNLNNSANHHDSPMVSDAVNKLLGEHLELTNPCSFDESQEENIHVHGNDEFVVSICSDASGNESKGAAVLSWVPLATQDGVANVDKTRRPSHVEVLESSIETEPSVEDSTYIADTPGSDFEFISQAVVTAEKLNEYHSFGEESELLIQTLSAKAQSGCHLNEEARSVEEFQKDGKEHTADVNIRGCGGSEPESYFASSQPKHVEQANECAFGVDSMARKSNVGDKEAELSDINHITESFQHNQNTSEVYNKFIVVVDDPNEVPGELLKSSETFCSSIKKTCLSDHKDEPSLDPSISRMKCKSLPEEAELQNSNSSNSELRNKFDNVFSPAEDEDATMQPLVKKSGNDAKQDVFVKPPPNAVPFSDEWLAAIEAAGEDILALKTGAVQHSPPDKSIAEPSPWSPVKRKNNQGIGPFDCTKYTNTSPS